MSGDIKFEPVLVNKSFDRPVAAVRVIREKAVHTVKVGEDERTSVEMTEMLNPPERGRTQWWMPALIAAILLTLILLIYFLQRGWNISSAANQENITPAKASPTYTVPG
jgi:hypothetical protein